MTGFIELVFHKFAATASSTLMDGFDSSLLTSGQIQGMVSFDPEYAVTFLTAAELRDLDADPVLYAREYWRPSA